MHVFGIFLSGAFIMQTHCTPYEHQNSLDPLLRSKMRNAIVITDLDKYPIIGSLQKAYTLRNGQEFRKHICTGTLIQNFRAIVPVNCVLPVILQALSIESVAFLRREPLKDYPMWGIHLSNLPPHSSYHLYFYIPQFKTLKITRVILPEHPGKWRPGGFSAKMGADLRSEPTKIYSTSLAVVVWASYDMPGPYPGPYKHIARISAPVEDIINAECHIQTLGYDPQNQFNITILDEPTVTLPSTMPVRILSENLCEFYLKEYFKKPDSKPELFRPYPSAICARMERVNSRYCRGDDGAPILCKTKNNIFHIVGVTQRTFFLNQTETCKQVKPGTLDSPININPNGFPIPMTGPSLMPGEPLVEWLNAASGLNDPVQVNKNFWTGFTHFEPNVHGYRFLRNFTLPE